MGEVLLCSLYVIFKNVFVNDVGVADSYIKISSNLVQLATVETTELQR